jgi:hypothetical protein
MGKPIIRTGTEGDSRTLWWLKSVLIVLTGAAAGSAAITHRPMAALVMGVFFGCAIAARLFNFGWVVPCTMCGFFIGPMFGPTIGGGSLESQVWGDATRICLGTVIGFVIGLLVESMSRHSKAFP